MVMGLYCSVFPLFKHFVLLFEMKEPLIHQLHESQLKLFKDFLGCYVKAEVINTASTGAQLKKLDLKQAIMKPKQMFMGSKALKLIQSPSTPTYMITSFLKQVKEAYIACGDTLQKKLALSNKFLKAVSALHPHAIGHTLTLSLLQKLPALAPNVLTETEEELYELNIRKYQTDQHPDFPEGSRIDEWWGKEEICLKYPCLSKMAKAVLSCFHGPQVESSLSVMNDVIDAKSGRLNIETYQAIQNIKYGLKASGKSAVEYFKKRDHLHDKVDHTLVRNVKRSFSQYKAILEEKKSVATEKQKQLYIRAQSTLTKRKAKELCQKAAKKDRVEHHGAIE
ncbi:uncharacterized protein LOC135472323 [Liolophura sinensis]|uniref:uncharacterized protein LOC135472323 n=1 Tax=Liolophura sinensis TaxID=3198878 RepID=UPI0031591941